MTELVAWPMDEKEYTAAGLGAAYSARSRGILRGTDFAASANGDLTVTIGTGLGCLHMNDFWALFPVCTTAQTLEFDDSDGSLDRYDVIALQLDKNENVAGLVIKEGSPAASPVYPTLYQDDDDYDEIFLYAVFREAGSTEITASDITDLRLDEDYCGLMESELDSIDTSVFQAQIEEWLADAQDALDGDVAGNLLNRINYIRSQVGFPDAYDDTATYEVGDYTIYDNTLYRCTTAVTTAGSFDSDYWEATTVMDEIALPVEMAEMTLNNFFYAEIEDDDGYLIADDDGDVIAGDWKYQVA